MSWTLILKTQNKKGRRGFYRTCPIAPRARLEKSEARTLLISAKKAAKKYWPGDEKEHDKKARQAKAKIEQ